jgi:hypothetical protein
MKHAIQNTPYPRNLGGSEKTRERGKGGLKEIILIIQGGNPEHTTPGNRRRKGWTERQGARHTGWRARARRCVWEEYGARHRDTETEQEQVPNFASSLGGGSVLAGQPCALPFSPETTYTHANTQTHKLG